MQCSNNDFSMSTYLNHDSENCSEISAVTRFRICPKLLHFPTFKFFTPPYCTRVSVYMMLRLGIGWDPQYAAVFCLSNCHGHILLNLVIFLQKWHGTYLPEAEKKHCQGHHGPKALSTVTHSIPLVQSRSFNKLWNIGKTSAWFCLSKGEKYVEKVWQIHITL